MLRKLTFTLCLLGHSLSAFAGIPETDGSELNNRWLVILGALDDGKLPANWESTSDKLKTLGVKPMATWSSYFKGLMPCWNIIVGGSYASKAEARTQTKALKRAGINNYYKHAGKYVGRDPRVESACAQSQQGSSTNIGMYPAIQWGGKALLPVSAPAPILERALEKSGSDRALDSQKTVWLRSLVPIRIGDMSLGKQVMVRALKGSKAPMTCKVKRFVALTWGAPHFAWFSHPDVDKSTPGCGEPQVMAELDCALGGEGALGFGFEPGQDPKFYAVSKAQASTLTLEQQGLNAQPDIAAIKARGQAVAEENQDALVIEISRHPLGDQAYALQHIHFYTGEGMSECGGIDFNEMVSGVVKESAPVTEFFDSTFSSIHAIIEQGGNIYFLSTRSGGGLTLHSGAQKNFGTVKKGFCDCGC